MWCPFRFPKSSGDQTSSFFDMVIPDDRVRSKLMDNLINEKIAIAKNLNISYLELDEVTYVERQTMIRNITEELQRKADMMKKAREG